MSMRTEVQESQEYADLAEPAHLGWLPWHCFPLALRLRVQWGLGPLFSAVRTAVHV